MRLEHRALGAGWALRRGYLGTDFVARYCSACTVHFLKNGTADSLFLDRAKSGAESFDKSSHLSTAASVFCVTQSQDLVRAQRSF